jgi:hypothetical protein
MKVELIIPIESLRGKLRKDGYYFRQYRGEQIVQRCPTTWKDTPARKAARERFTAIVKMVHQMQASGSKKSRKQLWKIATEAYDAARE